MNSNDESMNQNWGKVWKNRIDEVLLLMIVVIIWKSITIGWDDMQYFVVQVFFVTLLGTVFGEIFRFFWNRSHFKKS